MELEYSDSEVSWVYSCKKYRYKLNGIQNATKNNNAIYIASYDDNGFEYQYISFEGKLLLSHYEEANHVMIHKENNETVDIIFDSILDVALGGDSRIYILAHFGEVEKLIEYSKHGNKLNEYPPPSGYTFYRFGEVGLKIMVVVQGNSKTVDNYGRNDLTFSLDKNTGEWEKVSLAY